MLLRNKNTVYKTPCLQDKNKGLEIVCNPCYDN